MIGGAFTTIVNSLVNDMPMPVIGLLTGGENLSGLIRTGLQSYPSAEAANAAGVGTVNYGAFLQNIINFIIIAFCVFLLVKAMNKLLHKEEAVKEAARKCPTASPSWKRTRPAVPTAPATSKENNFFYA